MYTHCTCSMDFWRCRGTSVYMEIHVFSTLAYENKKEKKGNQPNHDLDKETYIARDTWMPSLENWGGGLKISCG